MSQKCLLTSAQIPAALAYGSQKLPGIPKK